MVWSMRQKMGSRDVFTVIVEAQVLLSRKRIRKYHLKKATVLFKRQCAEEDAWLM